MIAYIFLLLSLRSFDKFSGFLAETSFFMEGAGKSSLPIGVLTWHLGHFVIVLFWLRTDESPLFGDSFQVVFSAHCSIENLESASMTVSWLAQVFLLNFFVNDWSLEETAYKIY